MNPKNKWPLLLAALFWLGGCSTHRYLSGFPPEEGQVQVEEAADMHRFDEPVRLVNAFGSQDTLYFQYVGDGESNYRYTRPEDQVSLAVNYDWTPVYQLHAMTEAEFTTSTAGMFELATLDQDAYQAIRVAVAEKLTPKEPARGVLINQRDDEFFVWRKADGGLTNTPFFEKPPDVEFAASYRIEEIGDLVFDVIDETLNKNGVDGKYILYSTGESGAYARPFMLVNREKRELSYLSLEPYTFGNLPNNYAVRGAKVTQHFVRSYYLDFINRPFTNLSRLFFLLTDVVWDSARGVAIRGFRFPGLDNSAIPPLSEGPGMDLVAWEAELDRVFGKRSYHGDIDIFVGGDQFFPRFIDRIMHAEEYVKMRTYIFDSDDFAVRMADVMKARSKEIDIRILLDGLGTLMAQNAEAGTVRSDQEAPLGITLYLEDESDVRVRSLTNPWFTGDHSKTTIIDGKYAYVGGMNIGREYRWEWHDLMMELRGPIVSGIEHEFDKAWANGAVFGDFVLAGYKLAHDPPTDGDGMYPIRPLLTKPSRSEIYRAQLRAIRKAQGYIYIENAYFSDITVIYELARARLRGVDVRVIIPLEGNHGIMSANNVAAANTLLSYGVRVFAYPGMSHIKAAVIDGWACLGSANFDKLSFRINKELNLGVSDAGFVDELIDQVFDRDFRHAVEVTEPLPAGWGNSFASIVASQL